MKSNILSLLCLAGFILGASVSQAQTIPLTPERTGHAATLLPSGQVLISGGVNETATLDSVILYDPATGTLKPTGSLVTARKEHTSTLLADGTVLITGGELNGSGLTSAEIYYPAKRVFRQLRRAMSIPRTKHTATLLRTGQVLLIGGNTAEVYDPASKKFRPTKGTPVNRKSHAAVLLDDGTVLVSGGYIGSIASRASEIYNPLIKTFTVLTSQMTVD